MGILRKINESHIQELNMTELKELNGGAGIPFWKLFSGDGEMSPREEAISSAVRMAIDNHLNYVETVTRGGYKVTISVTKSSGVCNH